MLRPALDTDFSFLRGLSDEPSDQALNAQIQGGHLRVIEWNNRLAGFLKFHILWETLPFIEVVWLSEPSRGQGLGSRAVQEWEQEMIEKGFDLVLTSTRSDESAQQFWRKLGYADCGSFSVRGKPAELFLQKRLLD